MTRQVLEMVGKLEAQQQMRYAVTEISANLVGMAQQLNEIGEKAPLDSLESLGHLFEALAIKLSEIGELISDIESVTGLRSVPFQGR